MIPIILAPKYGQNQRNQNQANNSASNNINNFHDQNINQQQSSPYNTKPLSLSNNHSASAYNISSNNTSAQQQNVHQSEYNQDGGYNSNYATTTRTTHQYYTREKPNQPLRLQETTSTARTSNSQANLSQSQKSESSGGGFFSTLGGTLGRRKKTSTNNNQQNNAPEQHEHSRELTVEQVENEGKQAIDSNIMPRALNYTKFVNEDLESRVVIDESATYNHDFIELVHTLVNWINDELNEQRIIVKELEADLYDGQVLGRLVEKLSSTKLDVVEFTQNEDLQKHKLRQVLETLNRILGQQATWAQIKWSVEGIHSRNTIEIIHLLVTMIRFFRPPVKLPVNVSARVNVVTNQGVQQSFEEILTEQYDETGMRVEKRDAFDTLFDHAPDKLTMVKRSLCAFVNKHLNKINMECFSMHANGDLNPTQFSDGLLLIFLMASLENYFVPLGNIYTLPADPTADPNPQGVQTAVQHENYINTSPFHKLHNVNVAFQLMKDADINVRERVRAEDIVNGDLKSTLRVLYMIFNKYKNC